MSDSSIDVSEDTFDAAVLKDEKGGEVVASKEGVPSRSQWSEFLDARL